MRAATRASCAGWSIRSTGRSTSCTACRPSPSRWGCGAARRPRSRSCTPRASLNGEPIHVSSTAELADAVLATGFPYRRESLEHSNLENFCAFFYDVRDLRRIGSAALDLAYTAAGRFDGFWELHLSPHDVAGGGLLVREAGGIVRDADGGEDWLRGGSLVAAGPALFEAIRSRVRH
jgi:myo-inositol-1(or 4)-monophosphatase